MINNIGSSPTCPICLATNLKLQKHHIIPKEYGGPVEGPLLEVCATCHLNIHYTAEAEYKNKIALYLLPDQRVRATLYVDAIKKAKQIYESVSGADNLKKKVMIELTQKDLARLHKCKADKGFSSLEKYLKHLIAKELQNL
jgi:hypothetical protein